MGQDNACTRSSQCVCYTEKAGHVHNTDVTHQDEVSLISGQHKHGDVLVSQWGNDRLGDLCHTDGLGAGEAAATRHHVQSQPGGISHAQMLGGGQFYRGAGDTDDDDVGDCLGPGCCQAWLERQTEVCGLAEALETVLPVSRAPVSSFKNIL